MSTDNVVFRKIKEISSRGMYPRPLVTVIQLATELSMTSSNLLPSLAQLNRLRLVTFNDSSNPTVRLTLLGTVVNRDK